MLNARFAQGHASDDPAACGLLVHMIDGYEDASEPWRLCTTCPNTVYVDHLSASLVNRRIPYLYPGAASHGLVFAPDVPILCAFSRDVGSGGKPRGGCDGFTSHNTWLTPGASLSEVMQATRTFNEAIIDRHAYEQRLPHGVEAVLYTGHDDRQARKLHDAFLSHFGLSATKVPLLRVHPVERFFTPWAVEWLEDVS